jgi:hypothetical protein
VEPTTPDEEQSDSNFERDVETELRRKKVQLEAEMRLLSAEFEGSKLLTVEQMQDLKQDYLVEALTRFHGT